MIEKAIIFATKAHEGQFRKGVPVPYILHPMEVSTIVAGISPDEELIAAALLHDTLEDCESVTEAILYREFGARVLELVLAESEDKSKTWVERKGTTIVHLANETRLDVKILTLGDKLANVRSLQRDMEILGDKIWDCFHQKDRNKIAWYYKGVRDQISELKDTLAYEEYICLIDKIFG